MKAMQITRFGGPDVLRLVDLPAPDPGPGQVAIRVAYASVNYAEAMFRRGDLGQEPPFVPGMDVSGTVEALGQGVTGLRQGQQVAAMTVVGGYAEVVLAPAVAVLPLPEPVGLQAGAALAMAGQTVLGLLDGSARLRAGDSVLVHAAAGGIGLLAAQVARELGAAAVLGTVGDTTKADYARSHGYDVVVPRDGFVDAVLEATDGRGVDVVLESIGGASFADSQAVLAPLGRVVYFGNASGDAQVMPDPEVMRTANGGLLGFNVVALASEDPLRAREYGLRALAMAAAGRVDLDVTRVVPLAQAAVVHQWLDARTTTGKVLLEVAGG